LSEKPGKQQTFISRNKLAQLFGVTPRYISMLVEQGMPQHARGQFDFLPCGMFYARFLTSALQRRGTSTDVIIAQLRKDRIRLVNAQADKARIDFNAHEAKLIWRDEFKEWESRVYAVIREELTAMCHRVAPQLVDKNRYQVRALIDSEARATLLAITARAEFTDLNGGLTATRTDYTRTD
jgi:phage terminase Nu1 subunit (DNA packaging protein)